MATRAHARPAAASGDLPLAVLTQRIDMRLSQRNQADMGVLEQFGR